MFRYLNLIKNISNWPLHFKVKFGISDDDPLLFIARNNIKFEVPKRLHHEFKEIFMENAYFIGQKKPLKTNPIIIDIGANVGFFTMFALSKYPNCTVYSYEPVYSNFKQLAKNRDLNRSKKMFCFNMAVCGHGGKIDICLDTTDSFSTSATIIASKDKNIKSIEVPCSSLSDVFKENKIDKCDLLKLDCEGAEYEILYNAPEEVILKIDQMAIEVHQGKNEHENLESLKDFLTKSDFHLFQLKDKPHMLWAYRP